MIYTQQTQLTEKSEPNFLLSIVEFDKNYYSRYGVCFIDTSICDMYFSEFDDDKLSSRLMTLFSHYDPVLVLYERNKISERTLRTFKMLSSNCKKTPLIKGSQMLCAEKTLKELKENYLGADKGKLWPTELNCLCDPNDSLGMTPAENYKLVLRSMGGLIWYLKTSLIDQQVIDSTCFKKYTLPDEDNSGDTVEYRNMVLDAITLHNLRVIGDDYSLLKTVDYCCTKFGKRLLSEWLCTPSASKNKIELRQAAIKELYDDVNLLQDLRTILAKLPDLERLIVILNSFGLKKEGHPDNRASLYELPSYNKKKITDFITTLNGLEEILKVTKVTQNVKAPLLIKLTQFEPIGDFPNMKTRLDYFKENFDFDEALKDGALHPKRGDDTEFDAIEHKIDELIDEANLYLETQKKYFGSRKLCYFGNDKKRFQIEVPETVTHKVTNAYVLESQKKGKEPAKRYHTEETKKFLRCMLKLEEQRQTVVLDFIRKIFSKFSESHELWKKCVILVAQLDCLVSLAEYARNQKIVCMPEFIEKQTQYFNVTESYHPCFTHNSDFIPNDVELGEQNPCLVIVTGKLKMIKTDKFNNIFYIAFSKRSKHGWKIYVNASNWPLNRVVPDWFNDSCFFV